MVDDDHDEHRLIRLAAREGSTSLDFVHVCDGEALFAELDAAAMRSSLPDLVVVDVRIPGQDGISIARQLRSDGRFRHIPISMVSSSSLPVDAAACLEAGADWFDTKPGDFSGLVDFVAELERRSQQVEKA